MKFLARCKALSLTTTLECLALDLILRLLCLTLLSTHRLRERALQQDTEEAVFTHADFAIGSEQGCNCNDHLFALGKA